MAAHVSGQVAFSGAVRALVEQSALGFLVQTVVLDGLSEWAGAEMEVVIKNEFMMASVNGEIGCVFPDLIVMIDERGQGVMSSELAVGDHVRIVVAPCHPRLRDAAQSEIGREALGAARYGRPEVRYAPVERLTESWGMKWPTPLKIVGISTSPRRGANTSALVKTALAESQSAGDALGYDVAVELVELGRAEDLRMPWVRPVRSAATGMHPQRRLA